MRLNIHDTTPSSVMPKRFIWMFTGLFILFYGIFAAMAFCLIYYADSILFGIFTAILPFAALLWFLWDQHNLSNSFVEIFDTYLLVIEYPWGRKSIRKIPFSEIDYAKFLISYSMELHGPRIHHIGIPYIVFYNQQGKQLFKLLTYPEAIAFQKSITRIKSP